MTDATPTEAAKSVIVDSLVTWAKGLITALLPLIDARALVLIGGSGAAAFFSFPATMQPLMLTAVQLVIAFMFAVGVAHLVRKVLLSGKFDLSAFSAEALKGNLAAAIVFVAVLAFVGMLIMAVVAAILPTK